MSRNALPLPAQNKEYNIGYLTVRKNADGTDEVSLSVEQGRRLVCEPGNCVIAVSFDGAPPVTFQGALDKDWGGAKIVLRDSKLFVAKAQHTKKMSVRFHEATNGPSTYQFEATTPLKFPAQVKRLNG